MNSSLAIKCLIENKSTLCCFSSPFLHSGKSLWKPISNSGFGTIMSAGRLAWCLQTYHDLPSVHCLVAEGDAHSNRPKVTSWKRLKQEDEKSSSVSADKHTSNPPLKAIKRDYCSLTFERTFFFRKTLHTIPLLFLMILYCP